ncbi:MAG: iron-sulfur cluster assembly scaffold protein [Pseudomonadota bacterium]
MAQDAYSPRVRELFRHTPGAGSLDGEGVRCGRAGGAEHGAEVVLWVRVLEGAIQEARFQVLGCPHTVAAAALLVEGLAGQPAAAARVDTTAISERLLLPVEKLGRVLLLEDALLDALAGVRGPDRDASSPE